VDDDPISIESLVAFAAGEMDQSDAHSIEARISVAPELASRVQEIRQVLNAMQRDDTRVPRSVTIRRAIALFTEREKLVPSAWLNPAFRAVAELIFDSRRTPAIAGFRGGSLGYHQSYRAGASVIDLQIAAPTDPEAPIWKVRGQVESSESTEPGTALLSETQNNRVVAQAVPDEAGCFTLCASAGQYDLVIGIGVQSIVVPHLQLE